MAMTVSPGSGVQDVSDDRFVMAVVEVEEA